MSQSPGGCGLERVAEELRQATKRPKDQQTKGESNKLHADPRTIPLKSRSNTQFSAWSEYLGGEKDVDFIKWKKDMVGESQGRDQPTRPAEQSITSKESRGN